MLMSVWPDIVLCNDPVSGGGGVTGEKTMFGLPSVWTFLPLHSQKTLQKKRGGVSGRLHDWTISNTFQLHLLHTQQHRITLTPMRSLMNSRFIHQPGGWSSVDEVTLTVKTAQVQI